jgi:dimethylhistidine N-methyltransferase
LNQNTDELREILDGLTDTPKRISPKYFYDERGSQLFDEITQLPEYYLTETEIGIMHDNIDEIAELVGPQASLIEFGSGSSLKTRILLDNLQSLAAYVPVDISEEHLFESARQIQSEYSHIDVLPVVADFTQQFDLPSPSISPLKNIVYFPGSTIGNLEYDEAISLLDVMYQEAGAGGALLIGVDLQKDPEIIEAAYNDRGGVTAEFNLNMLQRLNNDYGADFDLDEFDHDAVYDEGEGRVVLRLISLDDQTVQICGEDIEFEEGEGIITEYSHKYTLDGFAEMASRVGFDVRRVWTDAGQLFSVQYLERD